MNDRDVQAMLEESLPALPPSRVDSLRAVHRGRVIQRRRTVAVTATTAVAAAGIMGAASLLPSGMTVPGKAGPGSAPGSGHSVRANCPPGNVGDTIVKYVDFLNLGGAHYIANDFSAPSAVNGGSLGKQVGTVRCNLGRIQPDLSYMPRDGDATFLPPGTAIYAMRGYPSSFRVAARQNGRYQIYEIDSGSHVRTGGDLLPITGLVRRIEVRNHRTSNKVLAQVTDANEISALVDAITTARVGPNRTLTKDPLFIRFYLADGTVLQRPWYPADSLLAGGIIVPPSFTLALQAKMRAA